MLSERSIRNMRRTFIGFCAAYGLVLLGIFLFAPKGPFPL